MVSRQQPTSVRMPEWYDRKSVQLSARIAEGVKQAGRLNVRKAGQNKTDRNNVQ